MANRRQKAPQKPTFERPVEEYFHELDQVFQGNRWLYALAVFGFFFGVMGLVWMVPFPKLGFLERMELDKFLNWGSFFIAVVVYAYLRLAPTLSYLMLFTIGAMSFLIVQLEYVERDSGPTVVLVCFLIAALSLLGLLLMTKKEEKKATWRELSALVAVGPIWLWSKVFDRLKWKY